MKQKLQKGTLTNTTEFSVRFSEVDSMQVVWHGNYARYLEDGREAFGKQYGGLGYMEIYNSGYTAPIVDMHILYKSPLQSGEIGVITTRFINNQAAKLCFEYEIRRGDNGLLVATANTMQVFLNGDGELELVNPAFYLEWKERWGLK